jgi:hypothetical protein
LTFGLGGKPMDRVPLGHRQNRASDVDAESEKKAFPASEQ